MWQYLFVLVVLYVHSSYSLQSSMLRTFRRSVSPCAIPLELDGQLDATNTWEVKFILDGEEKTAMVSEGDSLLESAEKLFDDVPSSCRNGVCTTCASRITDGWDSTKLAVHGLGEPQIEAGFVCACQCFPTGPGVTILLNQNDEVYEMQYGQYEKSYEMKYADKKGEIKKGWF